MNSSPFELVKLTKEEYDLKDILSFLATPLKIKPIYYFNGMKNADGWEILQEVRTYSEANELGLNMVVVKTHKIDVKVFAKSEFSKIDLMRSSGNKYAYWFEYGWKNVDRWVARKSITGFVASATMIGDNDVVSVIKLIICCSEGEYEDVVKGIDSADFMTVEGMMVNTSSLRRQEQDSWFIVNNFEVQKLDYSGANNILEKLNDWRDIAPMRHAITKELLFPDDVMLSIMVSVLFVRDNMAQFNTVLFGKTGHAKSAVLEYFTKKIMGGSIESATLSSGKGMGVSHAKDAPPSILLSEPNVVYVNEMFKSAGKNNSSNVHSYSITLKQHLESLMELLERKEVKGSSGLGRVGGILKASFIASENDDENLKRALGRAFMIANATFRRIQFGIVWRNIDENTEVGVGRADLRMTEYLKHKFGKHALRDIRSLYLYSRKFTRDHEFEAPIEWRKKVRQNVLLIVRAGKLIDPDLPDWFDAAKDRQTIDQFGKVIDDIFNVQKDVYTSCYVSAAVMRGWEVYNSVVDLKPVEDVRQQEMAEQLFTYFFICKLKILRAGIEDSLTQRGVSRTPYGDGGYR
jgi:hypothetical protein